jgi:hypothetical protein
MSRRWRLPLATAGGARPAFQLSPACRALIGGARLGAGEGTTGGQSPAPTSATPAT